MEPSVPTILVAGLALAWAVLVAVVLATVWLVSRMASKVDWKSYHHDQNQLKEMIAKLDKSIGILIERSEHKCGDAPQHGATP